MPHSQGLLRFSMTLKASKLKQPKNWAQASWWQSGLVAGEWAEGIILLPSLMHWVLVLDFQEPPPRTYPHSVLLGQVAVATLAQESVSCICLGWEPPTSDTAEGPHAVIGCVLFDGNNPHSHSLVEFVATCKGTIRIYTIYLVYKHFVGWTGMICQAVTPREGPGSGTIPGPDHWVKVTLNS